MNIRLFLLFFILLGSHRGEALSPRDALEQIPELKCLLEKDEKVVFTVDGPSLCIRDSMARLERYSVLTDRVEKKIYPHGASKDYISISSRSSYLYIFTKIEGRFSLSFFDSFGDASLNLKSRDYNGDGNEELFILTASGNSYCGFMIDCGESQMFRRIFSSCSELEDTSRAITFQDIDRDGIDEIIVARRDYYRMGGANSYLVYNAEIWKWNESKGKYLLQQTVPFKKGWEIPKK